MSMINDGGGFDGYRVFKNGSAFQPSQREGISVSTDGLQGSGLQLCALQTRRRSDVRPPPQSARRSVHHFEGKGSIILDGKRISMPEGTIVRVAPRVYRALGNDS